MVSPAGVKIGLTHLKVGNRYASQDLKAFLDNPDNIFLHYFTHAENELLGQPGVSHYIFSLVVYDQLAAALTLAREIKRRRPRAKIVAGGPLVARLAPRLREFPWITEIFDIIAPGEAYRVLPQILEFNQVYTGHVTPDYSDLSLDRYFSCRPVLPYLVAHGCKWGRCAFCTHHKTYDGYRASPLEAVVQDLEDISRRYGVEYISFSDEYLTAAQLICLADLILKRRLDVKWSTFARPEPRFVDPEFTGRLYRAGCRLLMFGLESASQRVLNLMGKGTWVEHFAPILSACKAANIAVRLDFLVGFPGETEAEAQLTYDFIGEHRSLIDTPFSSYAVAAFELREGSPVMEQADRFGIRVLGRLRGDLDEQYDYAAEQGLTSEQRSEWRRRLIAFFKTEMQAEVIAPQNKTHQLVFKDLYDRGAFPLPPSGVAPEELASFWARFGPGVVIQNGDGFIGLSNYATGGELHIAPELAGVIQALMGGVNLEAACWCQTIWGQETFAKMVNFLYRNDYLLLQDSATFDELPGHSTSNP